MNDVSNDPSVEEPSTEDPAVESAVNSQITDAVRQINATILGNAEALSQAMAQQIMTQSIALAMQNAVAQQQQLYTLRNAVTAAAARAILDASPEEALRFAREALAGDDVVSTLASLKDLMDAMRSAEGGAGAPPGAETSTGPSAEPTPRAAADPEAPGPMDEPSRRPGGTRRKRRAKPAKGEGESK